MGTQSVTTSEALQFLTFSLGSEDYGIPILDVQEIKGCAGFTPLPNAPDYVIGVMNLRGAVLPVYDLRRRFGMPGVEHTRFSVVIVVSVGARVCGLIVDAVSEVVNVAPDALVQPPELGIDASVMFVTRMFKVSDRLVAVIAVERICGLEAQPAAIAVGSQP